MAQTPTLKGIRDTIVTSLFGRRFGFVVGNAGSTLGEGEKSADFLGGVKGTKLPVAALTTASTAGEQIPNYGLDTLTCTTTSATTYHTPHNPIPGVSVQLFNLSTGSHTIWVNGSTATTAVTMVTVGSSAAGGSTAKNNFTLTAFGWADLVGVSTAIWALKSQVGSTVTQGTSVSSQA